MSMTKIILIMILALSFSSFAQTPSADKFKLDDMNCDGRNDQKQDFVDINKVIESQVQESTHDPNAKYTTSQIEEKGYKEDRVLEQGIVPGVSVKGKASKKKMFELSIKPGEKRK